MKVRYIINRTVSNRDRSGNCYAFAEIVSTVTGRRVFVDFTSGDGSNARHLVREALEVLAIRGDDTSNARIEESVTYLPIRQWGAAFKRCAPIYEGNVTAHSIADLETVQS